MLSVTNLVKTATDRLTCKHEFVLHKQVWVKLRFRKKYRLENSFICKLCNSTRLTRIGDN